VDLLSMTMIALMVVAALVVIGALVGSK